MVKKMLYFPLEEMTPGPERRKKAEGLSWNKGTFKNA
jgi:hypothetical protein